MDVREDVLERAIPLLMHHAGNVSHGSRTLVEHLIGTYNLLVNWGNPAEVCLAGLFHTYFGTSKFGFAKIHTRSDDRELVKLIGSRGTAILRVFSDIRGDAEDVPFVQFDWTYHSDDSVLKDVAELQVANLAEQLNNEHSARASTYALEILKQPRLLSPGARTAIRSFRQGVRFSWPAV